MSTLATAETRSAAILDGSAVAASIREDLRRRASVLTRNGQTPQLATVLVGEDPASASYVRAKHRDCAEIGIASLRVELPESSSTEDVLEAVARLNTDPDVTGFIVQLPLPPAVDQGRVLESVDPTKDVDGLHPVNLGRLVIGAQGILPCTPRGVLELLRTYDIEVAGAEVVIVGCGVTVGRPLGLLLTRPSEGATVTMCHIGTVDLASHLRTADIVVGAAGVAGLIRGSQLKPGAVVVDVGITRTAAGLVGDAAADVFDVASFVSPMPGGVGPMTRAMLMTNVVEAAERGAAG